MAESKVNVNTDWGWWLVALAGLVAYHHGVVPKWAACLAGAPAGLGVAIGGLILAAMGVLAVVAGCVIPVAWLFDNCAALWRSNREAKS